MTSDLPIKTNTYLVCVDEREESRVAMRLACMKAKTRGYQVCLLHVLEPADFQTITTIAERMREERQQEGWRLLNTLAQEATTEYGAIPSLLLREGPVGDMIVSVLEEDAAMTMIVIGVAHASAGGGKLTTWLASQLGSKLLVPLLMVPGNLTDQQLQGLI